MDPLAIAERIRRMGGVARGRTIGASRSELARAARDGIVARLRPGIYAVGVHPSVRDAAAHGGMVACASALRMHGVWVLEDPATLHVWLGPDGRAHPHEGCRCVGHRDAGRTAFGVVRLVHALVQAASCLGAEVFFVAFESAWRQGMLTRADRVEVRSRLTARHRRLVDIARADADSGLESLLRLRMTRLGLRLESQVGIAGVGVVDFLIEGRLVIEVDGRLNHEGASLRHKDLVRDAEAAARGFETLRFDYALIVHDWPRVERAVLARLRAVRAADARAGRR
ncbi:DUF559 domain-containing protein [Microbacterium sp. NPDC089189]|uniref:DUF559 domain-containing protein n=1 Tax=Microbacterium sp. NPDC089189 TaxID=3154972 RepID=UPI00343A996A